MKITTLHTLAKKRKNDTSEWVLVTGCFDILHLGHIEFFQFAKKLGSRLIVGVDNDTNITANKGNDHPFFTLKDRMFVLSELESIDWIFPIEETFSYNSEKANKMLEQVLSTLNINTLVIHKTGEVAYQRKKLICEKLDIQMISDTREKLSSSTKIAQYLFEKL